MATMAVDIVDENLKVGADVFIPALAMWCQLTRVQGDYCYFRPPGMAYEVGWPVRMVTPGASEYTTSMHKGENDG